MPKLKKETIIPTEKENETINRGIAEDADTYELADAEFKQLKRVDRPLSEVTKDRVTIKRLMVLKKDKRGSTIFKEVSKSQ